MKLNEIWIRKIFVFGMKLRAENISSFEMIEWHLVICVYRHLHQIDIKIQSIFNANWTILGDLFSLGECLLYITLWPKSIFLEFRYIQWTIFSYIYFNAGTSMFGRYYAPELTMTCWTKSRQEKSPHKLYSFNNKTFLNWKTSIGSALLFSLPCTMTAHIINTYNK